MKILVSGLGSIGSRHARNLLSLGHEVWVHRRSNVSQGPNIGLEKLRRFDRLDDALDHKPDALVVCNPTVLHASTALEGARRGIPLFIEKPAAVDIASLRPLERLVDEKQLKPVMVGHNYRFHSGLRWLKARLDAGEIGTLRHLRAEAGEYLPDWHPWEDYHNSYIARSDLGGGCLLNFSHEIDDVLWIMGCSPSGVSGSMENKNVLNINVDETASVSLQFPGGADAHIHLSIVDRKLHRYLEIEGEEGTAGWDYYGGTAWVQPRGKPREEMDFHAVERNVMYLEEMKHFLEAVVGSQATEVSVVDGRRVLEVVEGVRQMNRKKTYVA